VEWADVPPKVRRDIERRLGSRVVEAVTQRGGFSPALAARLRLADGSRVFLKAVSEDANPDSHHIYRQEARVVAALPPTVPSPPFRWLYDRHGWVALCFDDVDGRHPHDPWTEGDLDVVVRGLRAMSAALTPSPIVVDESAADAFAGVLNGWVIALERGETRLDPWARRNLNRLAHVELGTPSAVGGESLVHFDLRADNILISGDRVWVVDWPVARFGAAWVDWVAMAPSVEMQGGPRCEDFLHRFDVAGVPAASITAAICSLAGYFSVHSLDPPPPGIPTVRSFQAAQGALALRWLRERTGWR
jgi:aminoglycoside phosphotransferase (APT) family kinase protein